MFDCFSESLTSLISGVQVDPPSIRCYSLTCTRCLAQTVRFKTELERNITIKLGYANAKIYKCDNPACPRPGNYKSYGSNKEEKPKCERPGCNSTMTLQR